MGGRPQRGSSALKGPSPAAPTHAGLARFAGQGVWLGGNVEVVLKRTSFGGALSPVMLIMHYRRCSFVPRRRTERIR